MKIKGLTEQQIRECAERAGAFRLDNVRHEGNYTLFVLRMKNCTPTRKAAREDPHHPDMRYRRHKLGIGWRGARWTGAVCFHGFEAFMRECFKLNPNAILRSAQAAFLGLEDFDRKYQAVGMANVGSQMYPVQYREECDCYGR